MVEIDPTETVQVSAPRRKLPEVLSVEETIKLIESPDISTPLGIRDRAMLERLQGKNCSPWTYSERESI